MFSKLLRVCYFLQEFYSLWFLVGNYDSVFIRKHPGNPRGFSINKTKFDFLKFQFFSVRQMIT